MAHLTDMEELLASIPSPQIRSYMQEAMNCYMAGAYRGCVVLSFIALFDDLLAKLGELTSVNADAKNIFFEASKRKAEQDVFESYLIEQLTSKNLLSGLDSDFLNALRTLRNKSAHPSGHSPSAEEARFIYFETIDRFLSKPILSTTQLVDEIISRLENANFFPTRISSDVESVVTEEVAALHPDAIPQLVSKLVASIVSPAPLVKKNAASFIIGLARRNNANEIKEIRTRLINAKADDPQYSDVVLKAISANGALIIDLTTACIGRVRAALSQRIDDLTSSLSETKLIHPTRTVSSIAKNLTESDFLSTFRPELEKLFQKRPYSPYLIDLLESRPCVLALYFPIILAKAGSSNFDTANSFASSIDSVDTALASCVTDEQAFQLVVAVLNAAEWGSFDAQALVQSKFIGTPALRSKAINYVDTNKPQASAYLTSKLTTTIAIDNLVPSYLTNEPVPPAQ